MLTRHRLFLIGLLALAACDHAPAPAPEAVSVRPDPAALREKALFEQLTALQEEDQRVDLGEPAQVAAALTRWRGFASDAAGTRYATIASARIERLDGAAGKALNATRRSIQQSYRGHHSAQIQETVTRFVASFPGTTAAGQVARWGAAATRVLTRLQGAPSVIFGDARTPWKRAIQQGTARIERAGIGGNSGRAVVLNQPGGSLVEVTFELAAKPTAATLWLDHVSTASEGHHFTTIDVRVNDTMLCADWYPPILDHSGRSDSWPIGPHLRQGRNRLRIRLGPSALAVYWLGRVRVYCASQPPFAEILRD